MDFAEWSEATSQSSSSIVKQRKIVCFHIRPPGCGVCEQLQRKQCLGSLNKPSVSAPGLVVTGERCQCNVLTAANINFVFQVCLVMEFAECGSLYNRKTYYVLKWSEWLTGTVVHLTATSRVQPASAWYLFIQSRRWLGIVPRHRMAQVKWKENDKWLSTFKSPAEQFFQRRLLLWLMSLSTHVLVGLFIEQSFCVAWTSWCCLFTDVPNKSRRYYYY